MKRFLPLLLVLPALLAAGCQSSNQTTNTPPVAFPGNATAYIAPLSGSANGQNLNFNIVRAGDKITGSFESVSGTEILSGEILGSPTGTQGVDLGFYIQEDYNDFGHFVGQWSDSKLSGTWTVDGQPDAPTEFDLANQPDSAKLSIQAVDDIGKDASGTDRCEFSLAVPSVDGRSDINRLIDQRFGLEDVSGTRKTVNDLKQEFYDTCLSDIKDELTVGGDTPNPDLMYSDVQTFSVELNRSNLLSLSLNGYTYSGGAHGSPALSSLSLDLKSGKVLVVGDLFKADHLQQLQKMLAKKILDVYTDALFDESRTAFQAALDDKTVLSADAQERLYGNNGDFVLSPSGITFFWNVYDITPYAAGQPEVFFTYSELKDLINPDGPLGRLIQE